MKHILLIFAVVMGQSALAVDKKPLTKEESAKEIEKAIRKSLKKPTGELTKADLEKVGELDFNSKKLTEVPKGLEKLTQLRDLHLSDNKLTDVKSLEKLTQLQWLSLYGNQLTDVKGLENLTQLKVLLLAGNQLTDVKGLEKLTQLTLLHLTGNPDLTKAQIAELKKVLPRCKIYPLTKEESAKVIEAAIRRAAKKPTGELTEADYEKVTRLNLGYKQLTDVKGLENLTQLETLDLTRNQLTDVKGLEKLTKLTILDLSNNQLTDVKGLEKLTQLTLLRLTGNPDLTKAQIAELKKALPKCSIGWFLSK